MAGVFKSQNKGADEISIAKILDIFVKRWHFLIIFALISSALSFLYLRYTKPLYEAAATLKVEDNNNTFRSLGILQGFDNFTDNIQTEIQIIKSRHILSQAITRMKVDVSYYQVGTLLSSELYRESPIEVVFDGEQDIIHYDYVFLLEPLKGNKFKLSYTAHDKEISNEYYMGEKININGFEFQVLENPARTYKLVKGTLFKWRVNRPSHLIARARSGLKVEQIGPMVPILRIAHRDHVPAFSADLVNAICEVYRDEDMMLKQQAASQTVDFITDQLDTLEERVRDSEIKLEQFKKSRELVSVETSGTIDIEKLKRLEERLSEHEIMQLAIDQLENEVDGVSNSLSPFPFSVEGGGNTLLNSLITSYNQLSLDRMELLTKYTETSPKVEEMDKRLGELRLAISDNINSLRKNYKNRRDYYDKEIEKVKVRLAGIPETERAYINLEREYKVKENVFSTMLEKRAEASIAKASIVPSVRIVDRATVPRRHISPNRTKIYILGFALGISTGVVLILLIGMLKNTISYREEIEAISLTPVIGVVRRSTVALNAKFPQMVVVENPKSALSESIRSIRTNLQFVSSDKKSKVISITSTVSGEGKSFIILNLGGIISLLNKKVILLDLDLRKPKLHYSFGMDNSVGLSTFLVGKHTLDEVRMDTPYENLDVITSGPIPPNPAELLQSLRMELLLMELRKTYDYILVDTPPIGLVTDGTALLRVSDVTLYVIRAEYSKKNYAQIPDQLVEDQKVKNLYIIMNSVNQGGGKYGRYGKYGGYGRTGSGYYVEDTKETPWWKFWASS